MAVSPLAINIFTGENIWLSKFDGTNWTTQALVASGLTRQTFFSAGAVSSAQINNLGIVYIDGTNGGNLVFAGNGPPDSPVTISPPVDYTYTMPQEYWGHMWGAFFHNSAYWLFIKKTHPAATITEQVVCLRSGDGGATWAEQDTINAPNIRHGNVQSVYWNGAADKMYAFCNVFNPGDNSNYGQVFTFDTSANGGLGGWAAVTDMFLADGSGAGTPDQNQFRIDAYSGWAFPLSSGDIIAIYSTLVGGSGSGGLYVRKAVAGVWQAATAVRATPHSVASVGFNPATDTCYVFDYFNGTLGETPAPPSAFAGGVKVFSVDSSGTASADLFTFPDPVGNSTANGYTDGIDNPVIISGAMYVLYDDWNDTANAVWKWDMSGAVNFVKLNLLPHPPAEPPSGPGFDNPPSCGLLFFAEAPVPGTQTLELTKIVVGGPALPGDWFLSAETGSPPTGISGAGHVGPSEVDAATYELDEVAFPGITFDSETGTWQDDNHTWGGDYEAGAWDCGDATMPTPTSVIVPPGGTVACTITNTFIPTPPPPPPPGPGNGVENPVGCWELLRIDATLTPSKRLPVRGSVR